MKYRFATRPLETGLYEPEGIYLSTPFDNSYQVIQFFGQHPDHYAQYTLQQHEAARDIRASISPCRRARTSSRWTTAASRRSATSRGGFERYIKVEHRWGESFYAHLGEIRVEAGQRIKRNEHIAQSGPNRYGVVPHLHFAIRTNPYNRLDGYGGFTDPLPFLNPANIILPEDLDEAERGHHPARHGRREGSPAPSIALGPEHFVPGAMSTLALVLAGLRTCSK